MSKNINRRTFLEGAVASSALTIVPRHVLGGAAFVAPSEKITLAHIGMGSQGFNELGGLLEDQRVQIVAVCDDLAAKTCNIRHRQICPVSPNCIQLTGLYASEGHPGSLLQDGLISAQVNDIS